MASENQFSKNYFDLKPQECTVFDLVRILCHYHVESISSLNATNPDEILGNFAARCLVLISILLQKLLLSSKRPLSFAGSALELWLSLVSNNGGFKNLLLHVIQGKVVKPGDKSSPNFRSVLGNLDRRVELDRSIKNDDPRYNTALTVMASKLSYEYEPFSRAVVNDHWKMEFIGFYSFWNDYQNKFSTQAIMFRDTSSDPDLIVIAFRGTEPFDADQWATDIDISWYEIEGLNGKIHAGFMKALGLQKDKGWPKDLPQGTDQPPFAYYTLREQLRSILGTAHEKAKFMVTGHSLGAALAILFVAVLILHKEDWLLEHLQGVYTYGQPRVGDGQFGKFMKAKLREHDVKYNRYVYSNDIVPRVPCNYKNFFFKHFGPTLHFNGCYKGKVLEEEPNRNYFSLLWFIPKHINAVWELIRGFFLAKIKGPEYKEGWFMRFVRAIGLAFPGLSEHATQDYVNLTRLGSLSSFFRHLDETIYQEDHKHN